MDNIDKLLNVEFVENGETMTGADCWGGVILWSEFFPEASPVLGELSGLRSSHSSSPLGLRKAFLANVSAWNKIDEPVDHCLVLMREGKVVPSHVGVYHEGNVFHISNATGSRYEPVGRLKGMIHGFYRKN